MEAKSIAKVKNSKFKKVPFRQLLQKFEEKKILREEREKFLWFLDERHEKKMSKKRGRLRFYSRSTKEPPKSSKETLPSSFNKIS